MRSVVIIIFSALSLFGCGDKSTSGAGGSSPLDADVGSVGGDSQGVVDAAPASDVGLRDSAVNVDLGAGGAGGTGDAGGSDVEGLEDGGGGGQNAGGGALIRHIVRADEADGRITDFLQPNHAYLDTRTSRQNRLLVFLPGSNGNPERLQEFLTVAASTGVHVVGLKYNNAPSLARLCTGQVPSCFEETRLDIIYGNGLRVDRAHSIENRLITLLSHLNTLAPGEGWGQYLMDRALVWSRIAFAGHSQGGGHVGLIARDNIVDRAIMLNSPSDAGSGIPAPWISDPHVTSSSAYYAFMHEDDNGPRRLQVYGLFGMDVLGDPVNVDNHPPPYSETHILYTTRPTNNAHAVIISDAETPRNDDGSLTYAPVWRYLIGATD